MKFAKVSPNGINDARASYDEFGSSIQNMNCSTRLFRAKCGYELTKLNFLSTAVSTVQPSMSGSDINTSASTKPLTKRYEHFDAGDHKTNINMKKKSPKKTAKCLAQEQLV